MRRPKKDIFSIQKFRILHTFDMIHHIFVWFIVCGGACDYLLCMNTQWWKYLHWWIKSMEFLNWIFQLKFFTFMLLQLLLYNSLIRFFCLFWMISSMNARRNDKFADVLLFPSQMDGGYGIPAHKIILSSCSHVCINFSCTFRHWISIFNS